MNPVASAHTHNVRFSLTSEGWDCLARTIGPQGVIRSILDIKDRDNLNVDHHVSADVKLWCSGTSPLHTAMCPFQIMHLPEQKEDE